MKQNINILCQLTDGVTVRERDTHRETQSKRYTIAFARLGREGKQNGKEGKLCGKYRCLYTKIPRITTC